MRLNESGFRDTKIRAMKRVLMASLMVVLIGDPICCCAYQAKADSSPETDSGIPSCCRAHSGENDEGPDRELSNENRSDRKPPWVPACPCARKTGVVVSEKLALPVPSLQKLIEPVSHRDGLSLRFPDSPDVETRCLPPRDPVDARWPSFRVRFGVFRC